MDRIITAFTLIAVCLFLLFFSWRKGWETEKALAVISPGFVFVLGILGRYGLGSLIIALLPAEMIIRGEFKQYVTAWEYSSEVALLWLLFLVFFGPAFIFMRNSLRVSSGRSRRSIEIDSILVQGFERGSDRRDIKLLLITAISLLSIFFVGSVSASITGSFDRGAGYDYWASKSFRPEAAFVAFSRLRQIAYFLVPFVLRHTNSVTRVAVGLVAGIPLVLDITSGGRGSVLYPLVMVGLGLLIGGGISKKSLLVTGLIGILVMTSIPYIAAYRDSEVMRTSSHVEWRARLKSFVSVSKSDRLGYRVQALGREVYACSDSFLFTPENIDKRKGGFEDINLDLMKRLMLPRVLSSDKKLEKYDGSRIAQRLMGTDIDNWFPCITMPADLLLRGSYFAVGLGGLMMGILIGILDIGWRWMGSRTSEVAKTLLLLLPVSYIQSGLHGTIHEVLWQVCWELPKYVVAIVLFSIWTKILCRLAERYSYGE